MADVTPGETLHADYMIHTLVVSQSSFILQMTVYIDARYVTPTYKEHTSINGLQHLDGQWKNN